MRSHLLTLLLCALPLTGGARVFEDPAPPALKTVEALAAAEPAEFARLIYHQAPKPLAAGAITSDWKRFLGPAHDAASPETKLLRTWAAEGLTRVWEVEKGKGFASPAISGEKLILFHRLDGKETVECLHAGNGRRFWIHAYDAPYQDRYGSGDGPRASPVIAEGRVFTFGITGVLHCLDLQSGAVLWRRNTAEEFQTQPNFFGLGSTPLVADGKLIANIGGAKSLSVAAFDVATGRLLWGAESGWASSYASPVPATLHDRQCVLVLAGGESHPPTGGLLCIDRADGKVLSAVPWRAQMAESVTAASPVVIGNRVFVSEVYTEGGAMIDIAADFTASIVWKAPRFGCYWATPVAHGGCLFGFDGQSPQTAELVCYELATGRELWREALSWSEETARGTRKAIIGRGALLRADGGFLCLGEHGQLAWLDLSRDGCKVLQRTTLFEAPETWSVPALSRGLLYICQNERSAAGETPRLICYDFRGQ